MDNQKNNKGVIALLIVIIVILSVLCVLFATGTISFKSNKINDNEINENNNNQTNEDDNNSKYTIKGVTSAKFDIFWDGIEYELKINDGKLVVEDNIFEIPNEKIKYFYYNRYQCSASTVLYYLTEKGNVYVSEISPSNGKLTIEILNNFKKLDYSNVTDIVAITNENYGKSLDDVSGMRDNVKEYFYVLISGELFKLEYQYRC